MNYIISLKKEGIDPFIDYLKGISILFVVLTHCLPKQSYLVFSLWGEQAVPLFLLIQVFHTYKKGIDNIPLVPSVKKLIVRIFKPYVLLLSIEFILLVAFFDRDPVLQLYSTILAGGIGPGSYYVWIYAQFFFLLPFLSSVIRRCNIKEDGKLCLLFVVVSVSFELLCSYTSMSDRLYRLLFFRYFFLIYLGYRWTIKGIIINKQTITLSAVSVFFILLFSYTTINLEPLFYNTAWKSFRWICYFHVAYLFVFILQIGYLKINEKVKNMLIVIGQNSYDIFLLQMFVFTFFPTNRIMEIIDSRLIGVTLVVVLTTSFSVLPIVIYKRFIKHNYQ